MKTRNRSDMLKDPNGFLTPSEVGFLFHVDPKTVSRWASAGRISAIRTPGNHRRFRVAEIREQLELDIIPVYEPLPEEDAISQVSEGVHIALRKGCHSPESSAAWKAIGNMSDWGDAAEWFVNALKLQDIYLCERRDRLPS